MFRKYHVHQTIITHLYTDNTRDIQQTLENYINSIETILLSTNMNPIELFQNAQEFDTATEELKNISQEPINNIGRNR